MRGGNIPVEAVSVLKEKYPGFDKPLWSKCRHPERYGVRLTDAAFKHIEKNAPEILAKKRDKRSKAKSNRITFRTSEAIFGALQREIGSGGANTMQDVIEQAVMQYLGGGENE